MKVQNSPHPHFLNKIMKIQLIIAVAVTALLPIAGFTQPPPNPPPPPLPPGSAPNPPGAPEKHPEKKVPVTYLGVDTSEVPTVVSEQLGLAKGFGLVVDYVVPDGPAAAAGVQQNDILKLLNDQILTDSEQLAKLVQSYAEGTNVTVTVLRKGQEQKITIKLAKKEVPQHSQWSHDRHRRSDFHFDMGDFGMGDLEEQMRNMKEQLGEQQRAWGEQQKELVRDAVVKAREEANRAREQAMRARDGALRAAGRIKITKDDVNGGLQTTNIDIGKAQIVFSDEKGELRIEKIDGKKVLTAKDPKGLLLFSGPVETKEDLDKVPAEVRQRYENLEKKDLPAAISSGDGEDWDAAEDEDNDNDATTHQTSQRTSVRVLSDQYLRL